MSTDRWRRGRAARLLGLGGALAVIVLPVLGCGGGRERPNVLLVTFDTTRADHVGCYGARPSPTPNLDGLAEQGIVLTQAMSPVPLTLPAHATMMTGQVPTRHGVRNNGAYALPPSAETLAESFSRAGYQTGAFVSAFVLNRQFGVAQGFDAYDDDFIDERNGPQTAARALRWLARRDERRPFFAWVHFFDPHTPWTPPRPYRDLALPSGYDQEIAAADGALGSLLAWLERAGLAARTIVVVVGDHGEGLGDHGEIEHGLFLYQESVHVPWVMRLPGGAGAGSRSAVLASLIDLAPTLLDLTGLPPLRAASGASLRAALRGGPGPDRAGVLLETVYPQESFGWAPLRGLRSPEWSWIRAPLPELYNLREDPRERVNRAQTDPQTATSLDLWMLEQFAGEEEQAGAPAAPGQVSPEVAARLSSLGYVAAGQTATRAGADALADPKAKLAVFADFETGKLAMDQKRYRAAIAPLRRVVERDPQSVTALLGLGLALGQTRALGEAEMVLRRALALSPRNATLQSTLADALFDQWRYGEALDLYRQAATDPREWRKAQGRSAACLLALERADEARRLLEEAARADATTAGYFQGWLQRLAAYQQARARGAGTDSLRLALVRATAGVDLVAEVDRLLERPGSTPQWELARLELRLAHLTETGRPAEALETLRRLRSLRGDAPPLRLHEARLLLDLDRPDDALTVAAALLGASGLPQETRRAAAYQRAVAFVRLERPEAAVEALREAVGLGLRDGEKLLTDPELFPLRGTTAFRDLVDELTGAADA